ncbi:MAG TPA: hypothetical protein VHV52_12960 [Gaiellaceae bacterium]|nr:hypothetical protein [Gaiellaceae bacterium]
MGDLQLVDRLARLQLIARRRGYRLALVDPPAALRELIELVGLSEVLGLELQRQPEEREEHGGVEEERQLGDPPVH